MLRFFLVFVGMVVGAVKFAFLINVSFLYIVPFLGCLIGVWYAFRLIKWCIVNHEKLKKMDNFIKNILYAINHSFTNMGRAEQLILRLSIPHEEFKKQF